MYLIFNSFGHCELVCEAKPVGLADGYFVLPAGNDVAGFLWSDGKQVYKSLVPPPSHLHVIKDGVWTLSDAAVAAQLDDARYSRLQQLNAMAQDIINQQSGADLVPDFELATWPLQSAEAMAWQADKSAATPVLDGIAAARGIDKDVLKSAALRKSLIYTALSAHVAGQRQALQTAIEQSKTIDELNAIEISFTTPEAS